MLAKAPLAGDKIYAPAACAVPFRPYYGSVVTRTRNVSEYMLVLTLCLVGLVTGERFSLVGNLCQLSIKVHFQNCLQRTSSK